MDFKNDVKIDEMNLDYEWRRQPELILEYTNALADKEKEYADLRLILETKSAEIKNIARSYGEIVIKGKKVKVTESALSELVLVDEEYIENKRKLIDVEHEIDILKGAVEALKHKKTALEWQSQLFLTGYFGEPKTQRTLMKERREEV